MTAAEVKDPRLRADKNSRVVTFRIRPELLAEFDVLAAAHGMSRGVYLRTIILDAIDAGIIRPS